MPELPEVETVKNGLQQLRGTSIKNFIIRFPRLRYPLIESEFTPILDQTIKQITRRAKYLIFQLETGYLIIHLGMSGRLTLLTQNTPLGKHDHFDLICDQYVLRYNDPRRFGCIIYTTNITTHPLLAKLGPEPLEADFTPEYLYQQLKKRKSSIKQLIMDNAIVVGVGNIYACESLFLSQISPLRHGDSLSLNECKILVKNIQQVLVTAIKAGGSSLRDYKNAHGELGYFQQQHLVYNRAQQPCKQCNNLILETRLGQRNSFYCPSCQI